MVASFTDIVGIGLRIVSNREKIAQMWDQVAPVVREVTKIYPQIKQLVDTVAPGVTASTAPTPSEAPSLSVQWLQEALNKLDNSGLEVDGDYGEATRGAVAEYQRAHPPLEIDGWAGVATQASIYEALQKRSK
jgi:peptidoglycan hydrolase-like protein with peptidoglycan-binding domain